MGNILASLFILLFDIILWILPLVGTIILGAAAWRIWVHYIQQDFISGIDFAMLEIVPPREVPRSPQGMELFFTNALYHWSMKGGLEEYWQGAVWFWFSLEIASIEGQVHFYIRTPTRIKELIETQMYAQYPQCQVKEVEDYTLAVDEISAKSDWNLWGCEFKLNNPEVFPIKTYVDYGLDDNPDEEFKIDPISPVIELFSSMKEGEQMWMQILVTPAKKKYTTGEKMFKHHDWIREGELQIFKKLKPFTGERPLQSQPGKWSIELRAPGYMNDLIEGATKKMTKVGFETGIRVAYVAKKESFNMNSRRNLRLVWRQYENPFSNGFYRHNSTQADGYSGVFLASAKTVRLFARRHLHMFREREFFHLSLRHQIFNDHAFLRIISVIVKPYFHPVTYILNTEELATIWHFPGQILKVPTLERIESKEASPPPNLPM